MRCGLLGRKLGHSYSPQIHGMLGSYDYCKFEVEPEDLRDFLRNGDFQGLNVTMPYKKDVIPYLDRLSPIARRLGAVNTIIRDADGTLTGHNTDYFGFQVMLKSSGLDVTGKKCLVLGSGGASNTAVTVLNELGARVVIISRTGENNYQNLQLHADAAVIVNATPVGTYPNNGTTAVDIHQFPRLEGVLDLVYNPARTKLLLDAQARGMIAVNGLLMLVAQAKQSSEWFTGSQIPDSEIHRIYRILRCQMENIVLIGMPGCGKSTVGRILADKVQRRFADADAFIEELAGKSIPEIFTYDGESVFRQWETQILAELGKQSNLVIATGGGCVTQERNHPLLHQNSTVVWLQRELSALPTDGRPLSQAAPLDHMYRIRKPMYEAFADHTVVNAGTGENTADRIIAILEGSE